MPSLFFSKKYENLVKDLTSRSEDHPNRPQIFPYLRDLMLFAAMLGKSEGKMEERDGNGGEVDSTYIAGQNFNKDGVVYLLGLLEFDSPDIFKDGASQCWKLFEKYCSGGMSILSDWLKDINEPDEYYKVIQDKIFEHARNSNKKKVVIKKPKKIILPENN